jgi:hypothetical protein
MKVVFALNVDLCCRDENGNVNALHRVDIGGVFGLPFDVESKYMEGDEEFKYVKRGDTKGFLLGRRFFPIEERCLYAGNVCWDRVTMRPRHVVALIHTLQRRGFRCTNGVTEVFFRFNRGDFFFKRQLREFARAAGR